MPVGMMLDSMSSEEMGEWMIHLKMKADEQENAIKEAASQRRR